MEREREDFFDNFRLHIIRSSIRKAIKDSIIKFLIAFEKRGILLLFLKKSGDIPDESEKDIKEIKEHLGEKILEKIKNDFKDMESVITEQIKIEIFTRIRDRRQEASNNENFKKLKRFVERIRKPGDQPEEPDQEPDMCRALNLYYSVGDPKKINMIFYAMTIFKKEDYYEDELDENDNPTGYKLLKDRLYHSLILSKEDWAKLLWNPFNGKEAISLFETVLSNDPVYFDKLDNFNKDNVLMTSGEYVTKIASLGLIDVSGERIVNLRGTKDDKRESNWIEFWLNKTKKCQSERYCRIATENPARSTFTTSPHVPDKFIKGGHVRRWGEKHRDYFLILPICASHNSKNRWDEDHNDGSMYMVPLPKSVAVKIEPVELNLIKAKKRSIDDPNISINDFIDQTINETNRYYEEVKFDLENQYSTSVERILNESVERTIEWMNETYAMKWDDWIPIWGEIKAAHQTATMRDESLNKFKEISFNLLSKHDFIEEFKNICQNNFKNNNQSINYILEEVLIKVIG